MGNSSLVIDISKYNNKIDYSKIKSQVDGVIIRSGYRAYKTGTLTKDPLFETHISGCICNDIKVGVYFFTTAINAQEGKEEADYVVSLIKGYKISFPIFVDTEMSNNDHNGRSDKITKVQRTEAVVAFCERIKQLGYVPGIYASDSWFVTQLDYAKVQHYKLWVASYSRTPYRVKNYIGWQYTSSNTSINGTNGRVDTSYWYEPIGGSSNNSKPATTNPYLKPSINVKKGMKGEAVRWIQWQLNQEGYSLKVDGDFGKKTLAAVKDYQSKHKLVVDGIVGPITIASLVSASSVKLAAPIITDIAALYSAGAEIEENPKVKFEIGARFVVSCADMYFTRLCLIKGATIHGECEVLGFNKNHSKVKVKLIVYENNPCGYITGWCKWEDIKDIFE